MTPAAGSGQGPATQPDGRRRFRQQQHGTKTLRITPLGRRPPSAGLAATTRTHPLSRHVCSTSWLAMERFRTGRTRTGSPSLHGARAATRRLKCSTQPHGAQRQSGLLSPCVVSVVPSLAWTRSIRTFAMATPAGSRITTAQKWSVPSGSHAPCRMSRPDPQTVSMVTHAFCQCGGGSRICAKHQLAF